METVVLSTQHDDALGENDEATLKIVREGLAQIEASLTEHCG